MGGRGVAATTLVQGRRRHATGPPDQDTILGLAPCLQSHPKFSGRVVRCHLSSWIDTSSPVRHGLIPVDARNTSLSVVLRGPLGARSTLKDPLWPQALLPPEPSSLEKWYGQILLIDNLDNLEVLY